MDISCAKCMEPWDAYGVRNGDMESWEAKRFLKGEGCPCCKFGAKLPIFTGQIFQATGTPVELAIWFPIGTPDKDYYQPGRIGALEGSLEYESGELALEPDTMTTVIHVESSNDYGPKVEGGSVWLDVIHIRIGDADYSILETEFRRGFKLVPSQEDRDRADEIEFEAARSHLAASDEEPIGLLIERRIL